MFDASAFTGVWAFRSYPERTLKDVVASLEAEGFRGACISPVEAVLAPEPMTANRALFAEVAALRSAPAPAGLPFLIVLAPVIDPSLPGWEEDLQACLAEGGDAVRAVKIVPNYHAYALDAPFVDRLAEAVAAAGLTLCIQARMEDERSRHPLMTSEGVPPAAIAALAARHPGLNLLVCGAYMLELPTYKNVPNLHVEMSMVESGRVLRDAFSHVGHERLLVGTHAPLLMPAVGAVKPEADDVAPEVREALTEGNFRRLFFRMA